ncbi:MAG: hypothetical protein NXH83_17645, partial [Rhodobacteraceae bacterium]|nr:hypothetical protein [Paracoccaceae bacterium]
MQEAISGGGVEVDATVRFCVLPLFDIVGLLKRYAGGLVLTDLVYAYRPSRGVSSDDEGVSFAVWPEGR